MISFVKSSALSILLLSSGAQSFATTGGRTKVAVAFSSSTPTTTLGRKINQHPEWSTSPRQEMKLHQQASGGGDSAKDSDDEIERLRAMAARLRAEAAELEAEKARALADAAEKAFQKFDTNRDGIISQAELKEGLEKSLKIELSDKRVKELMKVFDASGDGALQPEEFVTIDRFRSQLDALAREEKRLALEATEIAKKEKEEARILQAKMTLLNDGPPTIRDKLVSLLPYLFPLMDGLAYGRFFLQDADASNPIIDIIAILYTIYRSIPFSGFVAFLALNVLSSVTNINRLIRYNMQQAIFIDIALFFPGLIGAVITAIGGSGIPPALSEVSTNVIFVTLLAVLGYCSVSSLLGITPDKLPLISQAVTDRMPTIDNLDDELRFIPRQMREEMEKEDNDKEKDNNKNDKN